MAKKMKIAISVLSGISYGGLTYFKNFIPALAKVDKTNEYHIFVQKGNSLSSMINQANFLFHECQFNTQSGFMRHFWEQLIFPAELRKRKIDIIFTAKNANILLAPCKTVISIQNMEPLCYNRYKNDWRLDVFSMLRGILTRISIKRADRVIAVSQYTKEYLERFFPGANVKLDVIYNGNPITHKTLKPDAYRDKSSFLLTASKFVTYANQLNLIKGYSLLCQERKDILSLWLVGGIHDVTYFRKIVTLIKEKGLTEKVKILDFIPHERLMELYSRAFAFVFPSTLEACPQTLIEAMACGVPIATSNVSPMPEICQDAAIYFDPFDKEDIARKINMLLTDCNLRKRLRERSLVRCQFFDWEKTAIETVRSFKKVCERNS
jgi:glycosyltransferase involved in cell wall biosynthesis